MLREGWFFVLSVLLGATWGCGEEGSGSTATELPSQERPDPASLPSPPAAVVELGPVLSAYEVLRAALAEGDVARLFDQAAALETAANAAARTASDAKKQHLEALAVSAARLAETPRGDLVEARRSFGEVSRHLVALLRADPASAAGLQVYSCERALGFQSWVQRAGEMGSPYTDDPCGEPSSP